MPELPEVETTLRGITPYLLQQTVKQVIIRNKNLRWPITRSLAADIKNQTIQSLQRRGKYLLLNTEAGSLIIHLGMSGSLRILPASTAPQKHDHFDLITTQGQCLRLHDPRRFGAVLWTRKSPFEHKLLKDLGPEPLTDEFNSPYVFNRSRGRKQNIKVFIMDSKIVTGVGNIYASEALFIAGIHPARAAGRIALARYETLVQSVKEVLLAAIQQGGTTLRDFTQSDGKPGYFKQQLNVYGRAGESCHRCGSEIKHRVLAQRATYFCPQCQK
ncbi:MAG: bifunctional DNA-formamidopyrimidine glycosylase/DNA-(apurinic or apyrimidinic site) lyase [Gammaproteobacteria bacterium]|nr:bifunctional DNA-formamidopyrimidine glycosylase/DNA-(apurinic or apyrimidinic site) lyase [Gammaproteobacteria bacterium]